MVTYFFSLVGTAEGEAGGRRRPEGGVGRRPGWDGGGRRPGGGRRCCGLVVGREPPRARGDFPGRKRPGLLSRPGRPPARDRLALLMWRRDRSPTPPPLGRTTTGGWAKKKKKAPDKKGESRKQKTKGKKHNKKTKKPNQQTNKPTEKQKKTKRAKQKSNFFSSGEPGLFPFHNFFSSGKLGPFIFFTLFLVFYQWGKHKQKEKQKEIRPGCPVLSVLSERLATLAEASEACRPDGCQVQSECRVERCRVEVVYRSEPGRLPRTPRRREYQSTIRSPPGEPELGRERESRRNSRQESCPRARCSLSCPNPRRSPVRPRSCRIRFRKAGVAPVARCARCPGREAVDTASWLRIPAPAPGRAMAAASRSPSGPEVEDGSRLRSRSRDAGEVGEVPSPRRKKVVPELLA